MASKMNFILAFCLIGLTMAMEIPLPMKGERNLLQQMQREIASTFLSPEEMQKCLETSLSEQNKINTVYSEKYKQCEANVADEKEALREESAASRQALLASREETCANLSLCSDDLEMAVFFYCYNDKGSTVSRRMKQISGEANKAYLNHDSKAKSIEMRFQICQEAAVNEYNKQADALSNNFQTCLQTGQWPEES